MYTYTVDIQELSVIRIKNTIYFYLASPESIKIFAKSSIDSDDLKQKFEFKGNYIGKKCVFRIDQKNRFKFMGEAKPPKDPVKRIFWEHGFTDSKRKKNIEDVKEGITIYFLEYNTNIIYTFKYNNKKEWWIDEDMSFPTAKEIMEGYEKRKY